MEWANLFNADFGSQKLDHCIANWSALRAPKVATPQVIAGSARAVKRGLRAGSENIIKCVYIFHFLSFFYNRVLWFPLWVEFWCYCLFRKIRHPNWSVHHFDYTHIKAQRIPNCREICPPNKKNCVALDSVLISGCSRPPLTRSKFLPLYLRGHPILSSDVPECSFHVGYKWVVTNVSMARGKFWGGNHYFLLE